MIFSYAECIKKYGTDYRIKKAIQEGKLYKMEPGIYSDSRCESDTAVIEKKYPHAVFTLNSAFYYQGLTDTVPLYYYLATDKNASKIVDNSVKQIFDNNNSWQPSTPSSSNNKIEAKTTLDISSKISLGINKFVIQTTDTVPTFSSDYNTNQKNAMVNSGRVMAILNIYGFIKN